MTRRGFFATLGALLIVPRGRRYTVIYGRGPLSEQVAPMVINGLSFAILTGSFAIRPMARSPLKFVIAGKPGKPVREDELFIAFS